MTNPETTSDGSPVPTPDDTSDVVHNEGGHDVIYTLRTAHQNQTQHLLLADQKANVLIGIVAVTLTILLSRVDTVTVFLNAQGELFRYGLAGFVLTETLALLVAIFVILPKTATSAGNRTPNQLPNPLHFGYFSQLEESEFVDYMMATVNNDAVARQLLITDLYQMGKVLKRKYRYLRAAYSLTILGFVILFGLMIRWVVNSV